MMDWILDQRTDCWSVMATLSMRRYLDLVRNAHEKQGGLTGQRDVLKTTTAKRIRQRMVQDIQAGALLPPVVIGAVVDSKDFEKFPLGDQSQIDDFLPSEASALSIIDGMQRTGAMMEAADNNSVVLDNLIRVEFWLAKSVRAMVYRMLVLNTGQVPWTLGRQLSVVYQPLLAEIERNVDEIDKLFTPDSPGRRRAAAQFGSDVLVELYLAFSLRKTNVETREALSEEFSRLDFVENVSRQDFQEQFYTALSILALLDRSFSRFEVEGANHRLSKGRHIFDSQPARIGFVAALAQHSLGRPGLNREPTEQGERMRACQDQAKNLAHRLDSLSMQALGEYLALDVLTEVLQKRVGQVGRYERSVFFDGFKVLIEENFELPNLEPCWRAS